MLADLAEQGCPRGGQGPRGDWVADGSTLHACTEWDKFHREDIALTRAISESTMASEMYEVCTMMDHMFGLGDGRILLRNAASATGVHLRSGRLPGATRKAVALCAEPGHLLDNFRAYAAGLHLREGWVGTGTNPRSVRAGGEQKGGGRDCSSHQIAARRTGSNNAHS